MSSFASIDDFQALERRCKNADEISRCERLLQIISDELRVRAKNTGKDIDKMLLEQPELISVVKSVVCDVCLRTLNSSTTDEAVSQYSQSAMGYSVSGTYLTPGGGIYIKDNELRRIGIKRQKIGSIQLWQ